MVRRVADARLPDATLGARGGYALVPRGVERGRRVVRRVHGRGLRVHGGLGLVEAVARSGHVVVGLRASTRSAASVLVAAEAAVLVADLGVGVGVGCISGRAGTGLQWWW